ncbi:MAG: hypothetical protein ACOZEN_06845 [Thermodesulfobacteriota bacterium]
MSKRKPDEMSVSLPEDAVEVVPKPECVGHTHPIYGYLVRGQVYQVPPNYVTEDGPFVPVHKEE